jgi:hypothetical protein
MASKQLVHFPSQPSSCKNSKSAAYNLQDNKEYTLDADMITGWRPTQIGSCTIPLTFEGRYEEYLQEQLENKKILYLGM